MNGFSISLLPLTPERIKALQYDVAPPAWPTIVPKAKQLHVVPLPHQQEGYSYTPSQNEATQQTLHTLCRTWIDLEEELNALDAKVGDGDTGSTFATAARNILAQDAQLPYNEPAELLQNLSDILAHSMGGSSGVLFSIFCAAAASEYNESSSFPQAVAKGLERMQAYGGAKRGDRTMLDALLPASEALLASKSIADIAAAADQGAQATAKLLEAGAGRSSYLNQESLDGIPDPGAVAVARALQALANE